MQEIEAELQGQDLDRDKLKTMVKKDLVTERTLDWLRDKAQVELVPESSLAESKSEDEPEANQSEENQPEATTSSEAE